MENSEEYVMNAIKEKMRGEHERRGKKGHDV